MKRLIFVTLLLVLPLAGCAAQTAAIHKATLAITSAPQTGVVSYNFYRTVGPCPTDGSTLTSPTKVGSSVIATPTFTDTAVAAGQTYCYTSRATDGTNESADSNYVTVAIPLFLPATLGLLKSQ